MGEVEELATARDSRLRLKKPWIPCLAVPRTALWQRVNPFTPVFICFPFPLSIGKLRFRNVSQMFKWRWKPHPLAQSLLLQRLVQHVVQTSVGTSGQIIKVKIMTITPSSPSVYKHLWENRAARVSAQSQHGGWSGFRQKPQQSSN